MTSGYILIVAILLLGGVIATVGDRLGTKVGKARLSLFNLRPRQTAVLMTILTGSIISGSTLAILFSVSDQLRTGVFELGRIQDNLSKVRKELDQTNTEKNQVSKELTQAKEEQNEAQKRLDNINRSLKAAVERQIQTEAQLDSTQEQLKQVEIERARTESLLRQTGRQLSQAEAEKSRIEADSTRTKNELNKTQEQLASVSRQSAGLQSDLRRLLTERQQLAEQIEDLRGQQVSLERAVQVLREGQVVLFRGQVLSSGVVRVINPVAAPQAVDQLLRQANRTAIDRTQPGAPDEQVIQITRAEVTRLIEQIDDGRDYVLRVLSAGNYVLGSKRVQVIANATLNQVIFRPGELIAATSADPLNMGEDQIREKLELLIAASEFRGQGSGILAEGVQIGNNSSILAMISFIEQLKRFNQPVDIQAVAAETVYTAGPLKIQLLAVYKGQVVFRAG